MGNGYVHCGYRGIGWEVGEVLGIPQGCRSFNIDFTINKPVIVRAEFLVTDDQIQKFKTILAAYKLTAREETKPEEQNG